MKRLSLFLSIWAFPMTTCDANDSLRGKQSFPGFPIDDDDDDNFMKNQTLGQGWEFTSPCFFDEPGFDVYVSSTQGQDLPNRGSSPDIPYETIQYAIHNRQPCQTIHVMEGVYRNDNFGLSDENNAVVNLFGVSDLKIRNYQNDEVIIEFDGSGGFVGGSSTNPVTNIELSGMEIVGPNANITYEEARDNRLLGKKKYRGRGIAIWAGHRIFIHDMTVHHCPGSGIRVNKGDYVTVSDNVVYSNTWWCRCAESAIVFAQSVPIDRSNSTKMIITGNVAFDNVNKIPYYNKNYAWNFSPIGGLNCTSYPDCELLLVQGCPWQCRYGKVTQDYIIDGSGVYVTRNNNSYRYGRFELSDNESYRNGINGVVFHRSDRGMVRDNIIYENGMVPRLDREEPVVEDWHEGCSGKSRQPYSGLVLNNAKSVELWNNNVAARYADDFAFKQIADHGSPEPIQAGGNNRVCLGKVDIDPASIVKVHANMSVCTPNFEQFW